METVHVTLNPNSLRVKEIVAKFAKQKEEHKANALRKLLEYKASTNK